jgi:16S rRNA (cytosine967-C5)-methyltransferase
MPKPPLLPRSYALDILGSVLGRQNPLGEALENHKGLAKLPRRDRAFVRLLVTATLRHLGQIDDTLGIALHMRRTRRKPEMRNLLRMGAAQLLFVGTPPHAAVNTSIQLAEIRGMIAFKRLINAVLRKIAADGEAMVAAQDAPRINTPDWLWESWAAAYGEATARAIATAHLSEPPLDLTCRSAPELWAQRLDAEILPGGSLRLIKPGRVTEIAGYDEGGWWVQDAAAALPARLLGDVAGQNVVDLCAAPGGKTAQLAAGGAMVMAIDRSGKRLARLRENLDRLHLAAELVETDAGKGKPDKPADAVLLDAPCSATGTIRRNPDVAWQRTAKDIARNAATQDRLLANAVTMLKPGGRLVYCVCSLQPEECEARIEALLASDARVERIAVTADEIGGLAEAITPAGDLRTLPCQLGDQGGLDGFFAARLRRLA